MAAASSAASSAAALRRLVQRTVDAELEKVPAHVARLPAPA